MSMREELQKQCDEAKAIHAKAAKRYRNALTARYAAEQKVRDACEDASDAANAMAALKAAIKALPAEPRKKLEAVQ